MLSDLIAAINELRDAIQHPMPPEKRLWDHADIAAYLKYSKSAAHRITSRMDFPRALQLVDNGTPRWLAREVIQWAESKQERKRA